jgi:hypothetical protein
MLLLKFVGGRGGLVQLYCCGDCGGRGEGGGGTCVAVVVVVNNDYLSGMV